MGGYVKPHLTYDAQLARVAASSAPTTTVPAEDLWRFDRKLRLKCLDALEAVEIGLRTQVAYIVGARDPFGHVHRAALDQGACMASSNRRDEAGNKAGGDEFDEWIRRYDKLKTDAKSEDFVRHHLHKYGEPMPVWVAVEFLDFGALSRLFGLLDNRDQKEIALELGVKGGAPLRAWIRDLNYVRNMCAHHNRMWNRSLTYKARVFNQAQVDADLRHAAESGDRDKIYVQLACLAYLLRRIDPRSTWHLGLRTLVKKFPAIPAMSPETDMGFPTGWQEFPLCNAIPAK
jgi:abortive infection bacteriophage resistance protein